MRAPEHETVAEEAEAETEAGVGLREEASFISTPLSPPAARAAVARVAAARAVYAVYAISSLDTGSSLRHRTQNMQLRRDTPGSCRARSPALHVGRRDRVASYGHVHRTRMLICMHIWGSSLFMLFMQ